MIEKEYAKALWDLALEENKCELFRDYFAICREVLKNDEYMQIMSSPVIDKKNKKDIIKNVYKKFDETFMNFLYVLVDYNRFNLIDDIGHQYRKFYRAYKNIIVVDVFTSKELTKTQVNELNDVLSKRYMDKTIEMKITLSPDLIGGIRIITNGESIDINLKSSLERLKEVM